MQVLTDMRVIVLSWQSLNCVFLMEYSAFVFIPLNHILSHGEKVIWNSKDVLMCDDIVSMYIFLNCEGVFIIYPLYMSINLILVPSEPRSLNKITEQSNKIFVGGCVSFSVRSVAFFLRLRGAWTVGLEYTGYMSVQNLERNRSGSRTSLLSWVGESSRFKVREKRFIRNLRDNLFRIKGGGVMVRAARGGYMRQWLSQCLRSF